jgi:MYXO-CTERM domain-containing protein
MSLLTAILILPTAFAWEVKTNEAGNPMAWATPEVPFAVNTDGLPAGVTERGIVEAAQAAAAQFSQVRGEPIRLVSDGTTRAASLTYADDQNIVFFDEDWADYGFDDSLLGVTNIWSYDDGEIVAFDMVLNAQHHDWTDRGDEGRHDLANTLTHEFGHALGLGHSEVAEATMFASATPGEIVKRDLHADDLEAIVALYGGQMPLAVAGNEPWPLACSTAPTAAPRAAWAIGLIAGLALLRRRR